MNYTLQKANGEYQLGQLWELYYSAFPLSEQKPKELLLKCSEDGTVDLLCVTDEDGRFLSLAICAKGEDVVLLDFLAVTQQERGRGIGGATLKALFDYYKDKRLVLEIESTEKKDADNFAQRIKRKAFYLKNGMTQEDYHVLLQTVEMEILTHGGKVSFDEYKAVISAVYKKETADGVILIDTGR